MDRPRAGVGRAHARRAASSRSRAAPARAACRARTLRPYSVVPTGSGVNIATALPPRCARGRRRAPAGWRCGARCPPRAAIPRPPARCRPPARATSASRQAAYCVGRDGALGVERIVDVASGRALRASSRGCASENVASVAPVRSAGFGDRGCAARRNWSSPRYCGRAAAAQRARNSTASIASSSESSANDRRPPRRTRRTPRSGPRASPYAPAPRRAPHPSRRS